MGLMDELIKNAGGLSDVASLAMKNPQVDAAAASLLSSSSSSIGGASGLIRAHGRLPIEGTRICHGILGRYRGEQGPRRLATCRPSRQRHDVAVRAKRRSQPRRRRARDRRRFAVAHQRADSSGTSTGGKLARERAREPFVRTRLSRSSDPRHVVSLPTMFSGRTHSSNCLPVTSSRAIAASRSVVFSAWAFFAIFAALS